MAENSKIEWTTHTFNPWIGCTKVSDGCKNCYAETLMDHRYKKTEWGPRGLRVIKADSGWSEPLKWDRAARAAGERHRVFCASLSDVFEGPESMPEASRPAIVSARARLIDLIHRTPNLDWLLLTKRPENIQRLWDEAATEWGEPGTLAMPLPNAWLGTSIENQEQADHRIPHLLKCPAAVRFLSIEPLLGPIEFSDVSKRSDAVSQLGKKSLDGIHWCIVGGESGPGARPMHPKWAESIQRQCFYADVPFFFKQFGEYTSYVPEGNPKPAFWLRADGVQMTEEEATKDGGSFIAMHRVGKKAAGRLLYGHIEYSEFPKGVANA